MAIQTRTYTTPEEFLLSERRAEEKSEYHDGEIFAMAGASYAHNLIVANVIAELRMQLKGQPCSVLPSDLRLWIESDRRYVYPDATVVCGEPRFIDDHQDTLANPTLLVEVLSKSTQDYDRGEKFELYRTLPSFAEYLLLAQDRPYCEHYVRQAEGGWLFTEHQDTKVIVPLKSIGCQLALAEIFDKVSFASPRRV